MSVIVISTIRTKENSHMLRRTETYSRVAAQAEGLSIPPIY